MALNRAWFDALIDDDGSNVIGTVWNKAQIDALLDSIDAELAGIAKAVWTPTLNGSGGGAGVYTANRAVWSRAAKAVLFSGRTTLSSKGSLTGGLQIDGFPFLLDGDQGVGTVSFWAGLTAGINGVTLFGTNNTSVFYLAIDNGSGTTTQMQAANLGAGTIDLWYGGSVTVL